MRSNVLVLVVAAGVLAGCSVGGSDSDGDAVVPGASLPAADTSAPTLLTSPLVTTPTPTPLATTSTSSPLPAPGRPSTTSTSTTSSSTTSTSTTTSTTTTTLPAPAPAPTTVATTSVPLDLSTQSLVLGTSLEGRPIIAERYGTVGGRRVLVIGVIHGNEDDGVAMIQQLRTRAIPDGVELWLVESMNPDGQAAQDRHNANEVDLNRNFPHNWGVIGEPGNSQYAGTGPASEPETQAMVNFIEQLRPDIALWYHQDANLVIPSTGRDGRIRARYAELAGLPLADCCGGGGIYTGIAATWARNELKKDSDAVAFIVELPGSLTPEQATTHTDTVLTIAAEG